MKIQRHPPLKITGKASRSATNARVVIAGHAFVQNLRQAHYELAVQEPVALRLAVAFDELALTI